MIMFSADKLVGVTATGLTPGEQVNLRWSFAPTAGTPGVAGGEGPFKVKASGMFTFPLEFDEFGSLPGTLNVWLADSAAVDQDVPLAGFTVEVPIP
jgi:hypothetical protein